MDQLFKQEVISPIHKQSRPVTLHAPSNRWNILVNILKPGAANTFQEFTKTVINPAALLDLEQ